MTDNIQPTKQRLRRAASAAVIDPSGAVLVAANDNYEFDRTTQAYVMQDAPLTRLARAGKVSATQRSAGERFYADHYAAGLAPLGAIDYGKVSVDGTPPQGHSDHRSAASDRHRKACKALGAYFLQVVDHVVLREISVEMAGRALGHRNAPQARVVALDRLAEGLNILARHYGLST